MHDKTHHYFVPPENENAKIWRYMNYSKFVSLLDSRALFFAKVKAFTDPYEGTIPKHNRYESYYDDKNLPSHEVAEAELKRRRPIVFVNSWHINEYESEAMWSRFSKRNEGVAIQSTYRRLSKSFDKNIEDTVYIGRVRYVDFDSDQIEVENIYRPFLTKRKSFEHEKELRVITGLPGNDSVYKVGASENGPRVDQSFIAPELIRVDESTLTEMGKYVSVDLEVLIEKIRVAPEAPDYFYKRVKSVAEKIGIDKKLVQNP